MKSQKFDSLSKLRKSKRRKHLKVLKVGLIFGSIGADDTLGLIGIRATVMAENASIGQQFKILALKDFSEVQEQSMHLNNNKRTFES